MRTARTGLVAIGVTLALFASTGCVSKKLFRKNVAETDQRVSEVETGVEENERRLRDLKEETDSRLAAVDSKADRATEIGQSAMSRADQASAMADKAIRGKLLYEITLSNDKVKFSFDQASIPSDAAAVLDDLIAKVKSYNKAVYVEIEGHTDNTGTEQYNLALGEQRAIAVRNYLFEGGIPLHAINVISRGEKAPVADNTTADGRAQNRRVVVKVLE
jgi:outer membrane protein OmpA-like peptidoglycan-associated protein